MPPDGNELPYIMRDTIQRTAVNLFIVAAFCFLAAALARPLLAELALSSAERLAQKFMWKEAEGEFTKALRADPFSSEYPGAYAEFLRISSRYSYDKAAALSKAIRLYDKAASLDPENSKYHLKRGLAKLEAGMGVKEAFSDFRRALSKDPNGYDAAYAIGYTGMNLWGSLDGEDRDLVVDRLAYVVETRPDQASRAYSSAWAATKDFGVIRRIAPETDRGYQGLHDFMAMKNLWQFRKDIPDPGQDSSGKAETAAKIKAAILDHERLSAAGAWRMVGNRMELAEGAEAVLERNKAVSERRRRSLAAPGDWFSVSGDLKDIKSADGAMYGNGTIYAVIDMPEGECTVSVEAKASPLGGVWPYMVVEVDGAEAGGAFVDSAVMKTYRFKVNTAGGSSLIGISFINDAYDEARKKDRNLFVGQVKVTGPGE
jgi:tetratricopeptide (TPR) repeat protein